MGEDRSGKIVFSLIIPTFNRREQLARTLAGIAELDFPKNSLEVIVVDDGGHQPLDTLVASFHGKGNYLLLHQQNAGPAAARNHGIRYAQGRFVAFTDDDCVPAPQWLNRLYEVLNEQPQLLVGGATRNTCSEAFSIYSQYIIDSVYRHFNSDIYDPQFFASNNMATLRELLIQLGSFNETFRASEDRELCDRWRSQGYRLRYVPTAIINHAHKLSLFDFCRQYFNYGRGAWNFHAIRRKRQSGSVKNDLRFHSNFTNWTRVRAQEFSTVSLFGIVGGLLLWQLSNATGFIYEAVHSQFRR